MEPLEQTGSAEDGGSDKSKHIATHAWTSIFEEVIV